MQSAVRSIIDKQVITNSGEVCAFDIIQAVNDFLTSSECYNMKCS